MVFNSVFPERELEKEKVVIADEIASYKDTPSESIFDEFEEQLFASPALGHNILGSVDNIASFDESKIRRFMLEYCPKEVYDNPETPEDIW